MFTLFKLDAPLRFFDPRVVGRRLDDGSPLELRNGYDSHYYFSGRAGSIGLAWRDADGVFWIAQMELPKGE